MRLDVFLKASRLIARRTLAKELCDNGGVSIDGHPAKPAAQVSAGQQLTITLGGRIRRVLILRIPSAPVAKKQAAELFQLLSEESAHDPYDFRTSGCPRGKNLYPRPDGQS